MRTPSARLALAGLITALVAASSGSALAEAPAPLLPAGWSRGGAALEKLTPPRRTSLFGMQGLHEDAFRPRPPVVGDQIRIEALPVIEITPSAVPAEPPRELPKGSPGDIVVLKPRRNLPVRVSVQGFSEGFVQLGKTIPTAIGEQSSGGLAGVCGGPEDGGILPLSYAATRSADQHQKGSLELVWAKGFFDAATCRAVILDRWSVKVAQLGEGSFYAFRTRCPACAPGERDVLHVLTPQTEDRFDKSIPFEHRTLALAPGKSAAFRGGDHTGPRHLEVSQGHGETSPVVFLARNARR